MNEVEQHLAEWLQRETPEPPRMLTAEQVRAAAPRLIAPHRSSNYPTAQCKSSYYLVESTDGGRSWRTQ